MEQNTLNIKLEMKNTITTGKDTYLGSFAYEGKDYIFTCDNSVALGALVNRTKENFSELMDNAQAHTKVYSYDEFGLQPINGPECKDELIYILVGLSKFF